MQLKKRFRALFADPVKQLATLMPDLRILREELRSVDYWTDPLTSIIDFFESVSKWHDRGLGDVIAAFEEVNFGRYDKVLNELQTLEAHFENAGRNMYGMNRTERGETVLASNVYLGDIWGLWTKSVPFWESYRDRPDERAGNSRPVYEVISDQARGFMNSHIGPICRIIEKLESVTRAEAA